jgi:hypothetical protein
LCGERPAWVSDQSTCPLLKIRFHLCFDIIDLKTDVMDPLAFGLQKLYERRIRFRRLDQFDIGHPDLILGVVLIFTVDNK